MSKPIRTLVLIIIALAVSVVLMNTLSNGGGLISGNSIRLKYSELMDAITASPRQISEAEWQGTNLTGKFERTHESGAEFIATVPYEDTAAAVTIQKALTEQKIPWEIERPSMTTAVLSLVGVAIVPLMILVVFYFVLIRPARSGRYAGVQTMRPYDQDVGTGAHGSQPINIAASQAIPVQRTIAERLLALDELRGQGLITEEEFAERRTAILQDT